MLRFRKAKGIKSIERGYHKILTADYVKDFVEVERFIECCKFCPNFGAKWGCPPYAFDVKEKYWNAYKYLHLFSNQDRLPLWNQFLYSLHSLVRPILKAFYTR